MARKTASVRATVWSMILGAGLVMGLPQALPAATHTWTGATSANWSVAGNWSEGTAPSPGESNVVLVFPLGASHLVNTNDIVGLSVETITITTTAASLIYEMTGNGITLTAGLTFGNPGSGSYYPEWNIPLTLGGAVTITSSGRMSEVRGTVDLNGNGLTFDGSGDIWVYGIISGSGSITKNSSGALTFAAANAYSGATTANAGAFYIEDGAAFGNTGTGTTFNDPSLLGLSGAAFTSAEPLTFAGGGVTANGEHTLSGAITLNANVAINAGSMASLTLSGPVGGTSGITKTGIGVLFLSGTSSYSGLTEVEQGDLCVTGSITSDVSITGAWARLMGSGSVGAISFAAPGTIYPKVGATPAVLTSNGGFTGMLEAVFVIDVEPSNYSRLVVNGPVNLDGITLMQTTSAPAYFPPYGQTYKLIENDGTDAVTGTLTTAVLDSVPEGGMFPEWGVEFNITYAGGTGNDVQMQLPLFRHAVANFDGDPADEAAVDFGSDGIWLLDSGAWTQISPANPEGLIPCDIQADGDNEIVADMGTLGLWLWDGGAWSNLTPANPEIQAVADPDGDGRDEILADFGATGLWLWDGGAWNILSSADVEAVTSGDVDGDTTAEVIADFGSIGLWLLNNGSWSQLSGVNADFVHAANLDADPNAEVAVDFGPIGLWTWDGGAWTELSGVDADFIASGSILGLSSRQLIGDFGSKGTWCWDGSTWTALSTHNANFFVCLADGLGGEDLFADYYYMSLWQWDGAGWIGLSQLDPDFLAGGDLDGDGADELLADFGEMTGLWLYDGGAWTKISAHDAQ